jgi:hypothetical protein
MATAAYYGTRLSAHISRTPEGFLIAHDVPLCRTAERTPMIYRGSELGLKTDGSVEVYRSAAEVLHPKHIASLEGKTIVDGHSGGFVDADNVSWRSRGHAQNIRENGRLPNGEKSVIGDLVITDPTLAQRVLDGELREVSTGYSCVYDDNGDGTYSQRKLRANHIALVSSGRAGEHVRIYDEQPSIPEDFATLARRYHRRSPVTVAPRVAWESQAEDRLPEKLRLGIPQTWDELARQHQQMLTDVEDPDEIEEEEEQESDMDEDENEGLSAEEVEDATRVLDQLRAVRRIVVKSGDRKAIDSYNEAVKAVKARLRDRSRVLAMDHQDWANTLACDGRDIAADYEAAIRDVRERMLRGEK